MRDKLTLLFILTMMFVINKTNAQQNVVTTNDSINKFEKDSIVKFEFGGSNYSVSKYIPRSGTQVGQGIANQTLAFISYSNLSTYFWLNYGFPDKRITEVDYGIEYEYKLAVDFLKGSWNIKAGAHNYIFPVPDLSNFILEGSLLYKGVIESDLLYTYCFKSKKIDSGSRLYFEIRKPFKLILAKIKTLFYPTLSSAYHFGFYGWEGFGHITPGVKLKVNLSHCSINTFLKYQISSNDIIKGYTKPKFLYGGLGIEF
ncbi:MAG: hypothetical protein A2W85_10305 [Bacteroidetes bacterium GWF2_41_31]|nr:MAG: hypothetical protein A2W85_10305 [Bacteroidetes bacterium GWF2_41_31]